MCRRTIGRRAQLIAVSGSYGKTTTTRAVIAAMGLHEHRLQTLGYNAYSFLYLQLACYTAFQSKAVIEIGIGLPGQMRPYAKVIAPDVAVLTAIGEDHIKRFPGGIDGILEEKADLVRSLPADGLAVLNIDDPRVAWMASQTSANVLTYGFETKADATIRLVEARGADGNRLTISFRGVDYVFTTRLVGRTAAYAIAPALALGIELGRPADSVIGALEALRPTPGRLEPIRLENGAILLMDDYKGSPATVHRALEEFADMRASRRIAVLGQVPPATPGPHSDTYAALGRHAGRILDEAYLIHLPGEHFAAYRSGLIAGGLADVKIRRMHSVFEAYRALHANLTSGDIVLLKGHTPDRLMRIALLLQDVQVRCRTTYCPRISPIRCSECELLSSDFGGDSREPVPDRQQTVSR